MTGGEGNAGHAHWAASANGDERRSTTHIMFPPSTLSRSLRAAALFFFAGVLGVLLNMVWDSSVLGTVPGRPFKSGAGASNGGMQSLLAHAQGPPTEHPSESLIRSILGMVNNDIRRRLAGSSLTDEGTMEKGHAHNGKMPSTYATPFSREMLRVLHSRHEQEHSVSSKDVLQNLARAPMSEERKMHGGRSGKLAKLLSSWLDQIKKPAKMSKQLLRLKSRRAAQVPRGVHPLLNVSGVCKKLLDGRWGFRTACAKSDCDQLRSDVGCKVNVEIFVRMYVYKDLYTHLSLTIELNIVENMCSTSILQVHATRQRDRLTAVSTLATPIAAQKRLAAS